MNKIQKLESGRAAFAYEKSKSIMRSGKSDKIKKEYKSYVKSIPAMIQLNGLAATFAFMKSKGGTYGKICTQIEEWLKCSDFTINKLINKDENEDENEDLLEKLLRLDSYNYRIITSEVISLFMWLRRFAEAMSKEGA